MLKPERMQRVRILGMKGSMPAVISSLHRAGVLEIREIDPAIIERGSPLGEYEDISAQLVRMRAIAAQLKPVPVEKKQSKLTLKGALKLAATLKMEGELENVRKGIEGAIADLEQIRQQARQLREIEGMEADFSKLDSDLLDIRFGMVPAKGAKGLIAELHKQGATVAEHRAKGGIALLIAVEKGKGRQAEGLKGLSQGDQEIQPLLDSSKFSEIAVNSIHGTPKKTLLELASRKEKILREKKRLEGLLGEISEAFYPQIIAIQEALEIEADRAQISSKFGKTEQVFVIEGWVPKSNCGQMKSLLEAKFRETVSVIDAPDDGTAPTKLQNPKIATPFEALIDMFSLPKYAEADPTLILMFTIPILYGLIVGDALYGIVSLGLSYMMVKKSKPGSMMHDFGKIWLYGAIPTILFGIAFDEYAGWSHKAILGTQLYSGFHRLESFPMLMLASLFIGMAHLSLGFILGFLNEREHSMTHAIAKLAWIGVMASGSIAIAAFMFNAVPQLWGLAGLGVLAVCAFLIFRAEGIAGIIEIPSVGGNVMSYLRIAAVGIVGVVLAELINTLAPKEPAPTFEGILLFALGSLVYIGLHVGHTMIAMFEGLIQGGRLNVVEFFGKFYHGNGARYSPFSYVRKYTIE